MHRLKTTFVLLALVAVIHACSWVKTTPEGEKVRVAQATEVENCERKGEIAASLKSRVGAFERKPGKVAMELETLSRNEGALMQGDTVVAESTIKDGRQTYGVYRCLP